MVIVACVIAAFVAAACALTLFLLLRRQRESHPVDASAPAPAQRWTVEAAAYGEPFDAYGGNAFAADGLVVGCNGHRSTDGAASYLVCLKPPDPSLQTIRCAGAGPEGVATFASTAWDEAAGTLYVFGGWKANPDGPTAELWRVALRDGRRSWEHLATAARGGPTPRNGAAAVFDASRRRVIVFGGDAGPGTSFTPLGDCWQYDVATARWSPIAPAGDPPPARWHAAMAVDDATDKAYLFGGAGRTVPYDVTLYELDLHTDHWRRVPTVGSRPPSLQGATFTFDTANGVFLLAGGLRHLGVGPATISDAWVFDPAAAQWDRTDCGEALRRRDHLGAYDPVTGAHYLFGGRISYVVGNFYAKSQPPRAGVRLTVKKVTQ